MTLPKLPEPGKLRVWMHNRTGQLVEVCNGYLGYVIFYQDTLNDETPWNDSTPGYFSDDKRWKPHEYEDLGEL